MIIMIDEIKNDLRKLATPDRAKASEWFFKTGKGQYGYGDKFVGVAVPDQRKVSKKYIDLSLTDLEKLLNSEIHEERLTALFILVLKFNKAEEKGKEEIYNFYLKNIKAVNNWDLVDSSAPHIIGNYLSDKDKSLLYKLARSKSLWEKRISIISTLAFIVNGKSYKDAFAISDVLLDDREDLIQKAVGWMLREVGKRVSEKELKEYLKTRYNKMGRTALRYAIERLNDEERSAFLKGIA